MRPRSKRLRLLVALVIGPTSLNGGEGLLAGRCMVGSEGGRQISIFGNSGSVRNVRRRIMGFCIRNLFKLTSGVSH
jgi:hypothetical protein